jgi:hypothetical protein
VQALPSAPRIVNRVVKVRADLGPASAGGQYRHSSGFVVRAGVVVTSAHGVAGARSIAITELRGQRHEIDVVDDTVLAGDPDGPTQGQGPDIALVRVPGLQEGCRPFPIARLGRSDPILATLSGVEVVGFPFFAESNSRNAFHGSGTISLLSNVDSGLVDVVLPVAPPDLNPAADVISQWAGISGAPVVVDGYLVAVVTEHARRTGPQTVVASPLALLDREASWRRWGPGVADPSRWWTELGVDEPARVPVWPAEPTIVSWVEELRALSEALRDERRLPAACRLPAGFASQAHEAILEALREVDDGDHEGLLRLLRRRLARSTSSAAQEAAVHLTTVGQVLTARTLRAVLDHLLVVHRAAGRDPLSTLSYRLAVPRIDIDDIDGECERWVRQGDEDEAAWAVLARLELTTDQDPYGELIATLSNGDWNDADPVPTATKLVDFVLSEAVLGSDALDRLQQCFVVRGSRREAVMLTATDVEPDVVAHDEHGFLVNEQPTLGHLRHGYFAPATDLDDVENAYWAWYDSEVVSPTRQRSGSVPTFWITGPSGAGKSILLLQLLARLNKRSAASVLVLGAGRALEDTARQALSLSRERHVAIGVDDPSIVSYDGTDSPWLAALDALARPRQTDGTHALPVFVCCAPTEHYERFRQKHAGAVQLGLYVLDPYRPEFRGNLHQWYRDRTGREPQGQGQGQGRDTTALPAQLFFEWWKGEGIEAFARRFHDRIVAHNIPELTGFFHRLLAVNRLYVGYPPAAVSALPARGRDALAVFYLDMHVAQPTLTRPFYWLSHPHLANLIYEEWFPDSTSHDLRGEHLSAALMEALEADEQGLASLPLLQHMLLALDPQGRSGLGYRVDVGQVDAAVRAAAARAANTALPASVLSVWIRLERRLGRLDNWSPLSEAVRQLTDAAGTDPGLRVVAMSLAEMKDARADEAIWAYLARDAAWRGWMRVVGHLIDRPIRPEQVDTLTAGVRARVDEPEALGLLGTALTHASSDPRLRSLAYDLLNGKVATSASLAPLAAALYRLGGDSEAAALRWLTATVRPENGIVLVEVLKRPLRPALAWAHLARWLTTHPLEEAADIGFAEMLSWQRLGDQDFRSALALCLSRREDLVSTELLGAILRLLRTEHPGWSHLFTALTPAMMSRPDVDAAARRWLERHKDAPAWHHVFVHFSRAAAVEDAALTRMGRAHLERAWDFPHGKRILQVLLRLAPLDDLPDIARTALHWLKDHTDDEDGWGYLVRPLLLAVPGEVSRTTTYEILAWWREHRASRPGSYVIRALLAAPLSAEASDEVRQEALAWLAVPHLGWGHVFLDLLPLVRAEQAVAVATPWLLAEVTDDRWAAVLHAVAPQLAEREMARLARAWFLAEIGNDSAAGFLWKVVIESGRCQGLLSDPSFRCIVNNWLRKRGRLKSWWHIWREMHKADPSDAGTIRAALGADVGEQRRHGVANALQCTVTALPGLADAFWEVLRSFEDTPTKQLASYYLLDVAPTRAGWDVCLSQLQMLAPDHYPSWWWRLWCGFTDDPERRELRLMGGRWLAENSEHVAAGKVRATLEEDASLRVTPATVFGHARPSSGAPLLTRLTVTSSQPRAPSTDEDLSHGPRRGEIACPRCRQPISAGPAPERTPRAFVCLACAAKLSLDVDGGSAVVLGQMARRPADPIGSTNERNPSKGRPVVHCDSCERNLRALIPAPGMFIAIDFECDVMHLVSIGETRPWQHSTPY